MVEGGAIKVVHYSCLLYELLRSQRQMGLGVQQNRGLVCSKK